MCENNGTYITRWWMLYKLKCMDLNECWCNDAQLCPNDAYDAHIWYSNSYLGDSSKM